MDLVGKVKGKNVIIVDDMIDTAGTLCKVSSSAFRLVFLSSKSQVNKMAAKLRTFKDNWAKGIPVSPKERILWYIDSITPVFGLAVDFCE